MMRRKILVADASETIITVCRTMLTQHGYDASLFQDGTKALEELKRDKYDLAIIATTTSDVSGYFVLTELRKDPAIKSIPVLMLLGSNELTDTKELLEASPDDTLSKPFSPQEMLFKIDNLLDKTSEKELTPEEDNFDVESILSDDSENLDEKISNATDKILLGALNSDDAKEPVREQPYLEKLELAEDQYDVQDNDQSSEFESEPHDYEWFVNEMSDEEKEKKSAPPIPKVGNLSNKFQVEEIGTSKLSVDQIKRMTEEGEAEKTKVYIDKLSEPISDFDEVDLTSAPHKSSDNLKNQFIRDFAEALAKEVAKKIDFDKIVEQIESLAVNNKK